jgi:hypothetical protein
MRVRRTTMIRRPLAAVLATAALTASACGGGSSRPTPEGDPAQGHAFTVRTHLRPGAHGAMFTEGAVPEIRLVSAGGRTFTPVHDHATTAVFRDLPAGRYRLTAALRPCDGNCGYLDPATGSCSTVVRVPEDSTATVSWRVGEHCHTT